MIATALSVLFGLASILVAGGSGICIEQKEEDAFLFGFVLSLALMIAALVSMSYA